MDYAEKEVNTAPKREIVTKNGLRVIIPESMTLTPELEMTLEAFAEGMKNRLGQEVYTVYLNANLYNPRELHDLKVIFKRNFKPGERRPWEN